MVVSNVDVNKQIKDVTLGLSEPAVCKLSLWCRYHRRPEAGAVQNVSLGQFEQEVRQTESQTDDT